MERDISIITLNYNSDIYLEKYLDSIYIFKDRVRLILVNIEKKTEWEYPIKPENLELKILDSENIGFAKANNLAARTADSKYLLFLNPDTVIIDDFLYPIISFIDEHPDCGACAPSLLYENLTYQSSTGFKVGIFYEFLEAFMLISISRNLFKIIHRKQFKKGIPIRVSWVSAACMLVKREVFAEAGGFSEEYFLNYEDIDLCRKIEDIGYKNYYFPGVKCIHLDHGSFKSNYELLVLSRYRSRLIYARKYYSFLTRILVRCMHIPGIVLRLLLCNIIYNGSERKQRLTGYIKSLKMFLFDKI